VPKRRRSSLDKSLQSQRRALESAGKQLELCHLEQQATIARSMLAKQQKNSHVVRIRPVANYINMHSPRNGPAVVEQANSIYK